MPLEDEQDKNDGMLPIHGSEDEHVGSLPLDQEGGNQILDEEPEQGPQNKGLTSHELLSLLAGIIQKNKVGDFMSAPLSNLSIRIKFSDVYPNYIIDVGDLEQIWLIFEGRNLKAAALARDLLLKDSCCLTTAEKEKVIAVSKQRLNLGGAELNDNIPNPDQCGEQEDDAENLSPDLDIISEPVDYDILQAEGKSLEAAIDELKRLNPTMDIGTLRDLCQKAEQAFFESSSIYGTKIINQWDKEDIGKWASLILKSPQEKVKSHELLPEMIAVMKQANFLFTEEMAENSGRGHLLRVTQVLSLLIFVSEPDQGRLLQIHTGEGKSTVTACLAAILSLMGRTVDIVTSSKELAKRDAISKAKFFEIFGLSSGHNCADKDSYAKGIKECYKQNIVYGDASSFQFDLLRDSVGNNTRGNRQYDFVIVDEVDSMCIDESGKIAMVASPVPGADYLGVLYAALSFHQLSLKKQIVALDQLYYYVEGPYEVIDYRIVLKPIPEESLAIADEDRISVIPDLGYFYSKRLTEVLDSLLTNPESLHLPAYLLNFILLQKDAWIKSVQRSLSTESHVDYIIKQNSKGETVVAPVDFSNTGTIHGDTQWNCGLHQFVLLKHGLKFSAESLTTSYISNAGLFLKYKNILGMSGTLGSKDSQNLLNEVYNVSCAFIPTFKEKIFHRETDIITLNDIEHLASLQEAIQEQSNKARAVLVICQTIKFAQALEASLNENPDLQGKISSYCTADVGEEAIFERAIGSGEIIIATNLAGRGTDIKTTAEVETAGGLHVILTFLPQNLRVEEQAFGRTSRQGNNGSAHMVINLQSVRNFLAIDESREVDIEYLKTLRDENEQSRLLEHRLYKSFLINKEDELYISLCEFLATLPEVVSKRQQAEENWGVFCRDLKEKIKDASKIKIFKDRIYNEGYRSAGVGKVCGSLYEALSRQLKSLFTSSELQSVVLYHVLTHHMKDMDDLAESGEKFLYDRSDQDILQDFADILECNIKLISDSSSENFLIRSKVENNGPPLVLSLFLSSYGQNTYESLNSLKEELTAEVNKENLRSLLGQASSRGIFSLQKQIFENIEAQKAKIINGRIESFLQEEFLRFKDETSTGYGEENYLFVRNPSYLVLQAINLLGVNDNLARHLLKLAQERDASYTFSAYFNYAYAVIRQGGLDHRDETKVDAKYMQEAFQALQQARRQILEDVIPNVEMLGLLSTTIGDSLLAKQVISRVDILKLCVRHIEDICEKIQNCPAGKYIDIKSIKLLQDCYPPDNKPKTELNEMFTMGMVQIFDVETRSVKIDWLSGLAVCCLGLLQVCVGIVVACTGNISLAAGVVMGGISDFMKAHAVFNGMPLDWEKYWSAKAVEAAVQIVASGISKACTKLGLIKPAEKLKALTLGQALPKLGAQLAMNYTVLHGIDLAQHAVLQEFGKDFEDDLCSGMQKELDSYFDNPEIREKIHALLAADRASSNNENANAIRRAVVNALKVGGQEISDIMRSATAKCGANMLSSSLSNGNIGGSIITGLAMCGGVTILTVNDLKKHMRDALGEVNSEIDRLYAKIATAEKYMHNTFRFVFSSKDIDAIIGSLKTRGILKDGVIDLSQISADLQDCMGLPWRLADRSELIKARLLRYAGALQSEQVRSESNCFAESLKDSIRDQSNARVLTAVKNNFAQPLISMVSAPLTAEFTEKLRFDFENVLSGGQAGKDRDAARELERKQQLERAQRQMREALDGSEQMILKAETTLERDHNHRTNPVSKATKPATQPVTKPNPQQSGRSVVFLPSANDGLPVGVTPLQSLPHRPTSILFSQSANDTTRMAQQLFNQNTDRPLFGWGAYASSVGATAFSPYINVSLCTEIGAGMLLRNVVPMTGAIIGGASIGGAIVGGGFIAHKTAEFESKHLFSLEEFNDIITNPDIPQSYKNQLFNQALNDPFYSNKPQSDKPITQSGKTQGNPFMDIDPNAGRPSIFSTPWYERGPSIESFPDGSDLTRKFGNLPGFGTLDPLHQRFGQLPGLDIHEHSWQDSILFKEPTVTSKFKMDFGNSKLTQETEQMIDKTQIQDKISKSKKFSECEKAESAIWKTLKPYKMVGGKQIRTNGLKGSELEYYHWDNAHKEIEVYKICGKKLVPIKSISPMTGSDKKRNISNHKIIKLD
jgi:preprotein translocase subunit SecA